MPEPFMNEFARPSLKSKASRRTLAALIATLTSLTLMSAEVKAQAINGTTYPFTATTARWRT
jgi:hypothetical protein